MLSLSLYSMLMLSKTTYPQKLFDYNCITLYTYYGFSNRYSKHRLLIPGGRPGVYTNIAEHLDWIQDKITDTKEICHYGKKTFILYNKYMQKKRIFFCLHLFFFFFNIEEFNAKTFNFFQDKRSNTKEILNKKY